MQPTNERAFHEGVKKTVEESQYLRAISNANLIGAISNDETFFHLANYKGEHLHTFTEVIDESSAHYPCTDCEEVK